MQIDLVRKSPDILPLAKKKGCDSSWVRKPKKKTSAVTASTPLAHIFGLARTIAFILAF